MSTKIEWAQNPDGTKGKTWNPVRGCMPVSEGCTNCFASRMATRMSSPGGAYEGLAKGGRWTGKVRCVPELLGKPLKWRKPQRVFVNSMGDLFHEDVPPEFIAAVFGVMASCPQHTFIVLTKRLSRAAWWFSWLDHETCNLLAAGAEGGDLHCRRCVQALHRHTGHSLVLPHGYPSWPLSNVWLGVSASTQARFDERVPTLLQLPAAVRFVSLEPLLEPVSPRGVLSECEGCGASGLSLRVLDGCGYCALGHVDSRMREVGRLDWVVVGGESGLGARLCSPSWVRGVLDQCRHAEVPCFIKQLGTHWAKHAPWAKHPKGGDPSEWVPYLSNEPDIREWPEGVQG